MAQSPVQSSAASSPALSSLSSAPSVPSPLGTEKKGAGSFFHPPEGKSLFQHWLIFPKLMYFLLANVIYANHAFGPRNMVKNWHLSLIEVSFLLSLIVVNFFGSLLWTWLSDRTRQHKIILLVTSVIFAGLSWGFWKNPFDHEQQRLLTIVWTSTVTVLTNFFQSALFPLCDSLIMTMLAEDPNLTKDNFGYQRLFSSIGHSVTSVITGLLVSVGYWTIFVYLSVVTTLFALLVAIAMPNTAEVKGGHHGHGHGDDKKEETKVPHPSASQALPLAATPGPPAVDIRTDDGHGRSPVVIMLTNPHFMFFMLFIVAAGMTRSVMSNFQAIFVSDVIPKGRPELAGYLSIGRLASELAMFWVAKRILRGLGVYWVLLLAQLVGLIRVLGYALLPIHIDTYLPFYLTIPLEMLKGINSSLIASSCIRIAADMAPKHCASTAQGLFSGNFNGVSSAVGALISALLFWIDRDSPTGHQYQFMFLWTVIISGIPSFLLALKFIFIDRVVGLPGLPRKNQAPGKPL